MNRGIVRLGLWGVSVATLLALIFWRVPGDSAGSKWRVLRYADHWYQPLVSHEFGFRAPIEGFFYRGDTRQVGDCFILMYGAWEKPLLNAMRDLLVKTGLPPGAVALDVGANVGTHAAFLSRYCGHVHAIEPYEPALVRLRRFIADNGITNIAVHPVGLGNQATNLVFFEPPESENGIGGFVDSTADRHTRVSQRTLPIVRGDRLVADGGMERVDLIKIDVEGFEKLVLEGLHDTTAKFRPFVVFELNAGNSAPSLFRDAEEIRSVFPASYEFFVFDAGRTRPRSGEYGLVPLGAWVAPQTNWQMLGNVVAIPSERRASVGSVIGPAGESGLTDSKRW